MMKTTLRGLAVVPLAAALSVSAQRYATEVFTDAQLTITPDVEFGQNVDFLTSDQIRRVAGVLDTREQWHHHVLELCQITRIDRRRTALPI